MTSQEVKRKLTAILAADMVSYSRLMSIDESGTLAALRAHRRELIDPKIAEHHGRTVKTTGDGMLVEFPSVVEAVQCAVEVQRAMIPRNAGISPDLAMSFRVGIHQGDVVEEEGDIFGDGVNVVARLVELAEPGGLCISERVHEDIAGKLILDCLDLGNKYLKNIARPVRVYKVQIEPKVASSRPPVEVASREKMAFPMPDLPSIAVLPFENMSGEKEQEYFSDGLAEGIINGLSKCQHIFVIARNSTFTYKGKPVKVKQVAEEMGVRYVMEGSVQREGNRVRITVQLIDALTGRHLFSDRYDRDLKDILILQDEITMKTLTAVQVKLTGGEGARLWAKGTKNLDAYLKLLQARKDCHIMSKEKQSLARQSAEEAIALDPQYTAAYEILAGVTINEVAIGGHKNPREALERAVELGRKAVALDDSSSNAHAVLSFPYTLLREYEKAISEAEKAVSLEPNSAMAHHALGHALVFLGRFEEAITFFKKSLRLSPIPITPNVLFLLGFSYRLLGRYEEAVGAYKKLIQLWGPDHLLAHLELVATYMLMGFENEAHGEAAEVMEIDPNFSVESYARILPFQDRKINDDIFVSLLRKAGLK